MLRTGHLALRLVVVVTLKQILNRIPPQQLLILLNCLRVLPIGVVHMLQIKVVLLGGGNKGRRQLPLQQRLPIEILEPVVSLYLPISIQTQPVRWLPL